MIRAGCGRVRRAARGRFGDDGCVKIAVTGSTGLIGTALVTRLHQAGHDVVRLVRHAPRRPDEVAWDPEAGTVDVERLAGVEAAVHLAGAGVGDKRWTEDYKRVIRDSRVLGTRTLVKALTSLDPLPRVLVSGSAVGFYGDRGDEELTEESPGGHGFLADVVRAWEAETEPASAAGVRVATIRTGLVMSPSRRRVRPHPAAAQARSRPVHWAAAGSGGRGSRSRTRSAPSCSCSPTRCPVRSTSPRRTRPPSARS